MLILPPANKLWLASNVSGIFALCHNFPSHSPECRDIPEPGNEATLSATRLLWRAVCLKTNISINLRKRGDGSFWRRRICFAATIFFRGNKFSVDRFIFRSTIVYQTTKHFQVNESDSEESGWRVDDCRQTIQWKSS